MDKNMLSSYIFIMKTKIKEEKWFGLDFALTFFMSFIEAIIYFFLFHYFFEQSSIIDSKDLVLYYIIINIITISYNPAQYVAWIHMEDITKGKIILDLVKPLSYKMRRYAETFIVFFLRMTINSIFLVIAFIILGKTISINAIIKGGFSIVMGFTILYLIQAIIGSMSIWFHDIFKLRNVCMTLLMILGGQIIPSKLLYSNLKKLVYYTPIPYVYDVPINTLMDNSSAKELLIQMCWILLLIVLYKRIIDKCVIHDIELGG